MISIVNYGLGNLGSIRNMLSHLGIPAVIADRPEDILNAERLILPGVGAFDSGMQHLTSGGWIDALNQKVHAEQVPVLGICLGMQLMARESEEGTLKGLGWVDAKVKKFHFEPGSPLKVPHMGWNDVTIRRQNSLLTESGAEHRFYFVHSYHVNLVHPEDEILSTTYGIPFTSGFQRRNIIGVQFHPEKSHKYGMELLRHFAGIQ